MDYKTFLQIIEKNPDAKILEPVDLPDLSNDPAVLKKAEEVKPYLRPECFPPALKFLIQPGEDYLKKLNS
jgi:hypothetical protein